MDESAERDGPDLRIFEVGAENAGERLDRFLAAALEGRSRAEAQRLIAGGFVRVNGAAEKASHRVRRADAVEVRLPAPRPLAIAAEAIPLAVLVEDDDLLVVNKSGDMIVHPAGRITTGTLVNALLARCPNLSGIGGVQKPGIVHRLDKGTSGCILVAKNDAAHWALSAQFARREVRKVYLAIVHGRPRMAEGTIEAPIGRHPVERKRMAVRPERGRSAVTRYAVAERFEGFSLVRVELLTGRTHQIRVHLAHLGCPVLGDAVYGRGKPREAVGTVVLRPMLHSWRLAFVHPGTGEWVRTEAPLPDDMGRLLERLRAVRHARAAEG